jgi:PAS domain S-box-containing protein
VEEGPDREASDTDAGVDEAFHLDHERLVSVMPDPAVVVGEDGTILVANNLVAKLFGYEPDELVGQPVETLVPERFRHPHRDYRAKFVLRPHQRTMGAGLELFGRRKDGGELPVDISLSPLPSAAGVRVLAAIRDITGLKEAAASQAHLGAIVQSSLDGIISMTLEGVVTSWNPGAERVLGYEASEVIGKHVSMLLPPGGSEELETLFAGVGTLPVAGALDTMWRRSSGDPVAVAISVSGVAAPSGELTGYSVIVRDITERKAAESELHRLLHEEQQRERQQAATSEIRFAMLSGADAEDVLTLICERTRDLFDVEMAVIGLAESGELAVAAATGFGSAPSPAAALRDPLVERTVSSGEPQAAVDPPSGTSPVACVPIIQNDAIAGVLVALSSTGGQSVRLPVLEGLADQASMTLELGRAREDRERLVLVADRERIARDLHDIVIQRLFAAGMSLEASLRLVRDEQVIARVSSAIDDLDETVRTIRSVIFELEPWTTTTTSVRAEILELAKEAGDRLGFEPAVRFEGPIDAAVGDDVRPHLLAVVREALSNAVRHAQASSVTVSVSAVDGEIALVVSDDGVGIDDVESLRQSGLANLRERAEQLDGKFSFAGTAGGGTRLEWRVPR